MLVVDSAEKLSEALASFRRDSIGFVPTMGALHAGHAALLERSKKENGCTVLSIYVNPTQFGPNEDFQKYPRTLNADVELAEKSGVDIVFAPADSVIYPPGFSTSIDVGAVAEPLCGKFRPGHFRGVATVVARLFNLVCPDRAYFGQKDIQQCLVIQRMVRDLALPVEVVIVPTVREADGLALSSRNRYLSPAERERAAVLYRALRSAFDLVGKGGAAQASEVLARARKIIEAEATLKLQYLELRSFPDLAPLEAITGPAVFAVAAHSGSTRLIDNLILEPRA